MNDFAQLFLETGNQSDAFQRIAAEIEVVIVQADLAEAKILAPMLRKPLLKSVARRDEGRRKRRARMTRPARN